MRCPYCSDDANRVIDSRVVRDQKEIRRRRECEECGRRFTTRERVEEAFPKVIKRDARREEYDRAKLLHGLENACVKRPVSADAIARLVERVERRLQESGSSEISSGEIGQRLLDELTAIDALAAVRFASVFRNFESTEDYAAFFEGLSEEGPSEQDEREEATEDREREDREREDQDTEDQDRRDKGREEPHHSGPPPRKLRLARDESGG